MTTITREQQKQILIDTANHVISRDNTSPYSENLRELARIALASLDAEPPHAIQTAPALNLSNKNSAPLHATPKGNRLRIAEDKLAEYSLSKREPQPTPESADRKMLKRLAVIMSGSDSGGEISALTVTAQSLVDRCKALTLANETMDVERLREIAEEDNGSDVKFEYSVMARMLLSVALNSDPVAYTDAEELES